MSAAIALGTTQVYGALTVDCLNPGELEKEVDTPRMAILAGLLAITYACDTPRNHDPSTTKPTTVGSSPRVDHSVWDSIDGSATRLRRRQ